jgi:RNA polymerase sigma factor (sigma-70 family)
MEQYDEARVIRLCKKQDRTGQELLFKKYSAAMYGVCVRYVKNREEGRDLLHDGFIKVFDKIRSFKGDSNISTWMTRIFINLSLDHLKKAVSRNIYSDMENPAFDLPEYEDDTEISINSVSGGQVLEAVYKLPDRYRLIVNLHIVDEYSHREISEMLGIPEGTSKSHLSRALKLMTNMIAQTKINV